MEFWRVVILLIEEIIELDREDLKIYNVVKDELVFVENEKVILN